ncbi:MAG: HD domain-containing protein [Patescibacteria group bacterium]|nr:HD domain-containing protein [Patescibacteria group bacterium]
MKPEAIIIPDEAKRICAQLEEAGFEAYLVGGCVRDMLLDKKPKDWDVATNARPEEVLKIFPDSIYENEFGTVLVKMKENGEWKTKNGIRTVEITTYRIEGKYTDKRRPDEVRFAKTIEEDLSRRDFTVNALALRGFGEGVMAGVILDLFGGQDDLKKKIIRTVGDPEKRFDEDALRLMRAVRFAVQLDFEIEAETWAAIQKHARGLEIIAKERIRDELAKILLAPNAAKGILMLEELGLLKYILPELREGIGVGQNLHHIYTVFEHNVRALDYAAKQQYDLPIRMAALLHDAGKPRAKQGEGYHATFYQHEYIGAKMAVRALDRLRFPREFVEKVAHLVRRHMFYYNVGDVSPAGVRRLLVRIGPEHVDDLLKVREADRIGSGVQKAVPYKLRHLLFMMDKVKRDPLSPKMLKINGDDIMELLGLPPGMRIGWILHSLLEEVLDDPEKNEREHLIRRTRELNALSDDELKELTLKAKRKEKEAEEAAEQEIRKKHRV